MSILDLTALELSAAIKEKKYTVTDAVKAVLQRIADCDGEYNCYER